MTQLELLCLEDREVVHLLAQHRFNFVSEKELQAGMEYVFMRGGCKFHREHRLDRHSIVDFMFASGMALEAKVGGSRASIIRQLHRYAQFDEVKCLMLVTNKVNHRSMPDLINDKPVYVITLGANQF